MLSIALLAAASLPGILAYCLFLIISRKVWAKVPENPTLLNGGSGQSITATVVVVARNEEQSIFHLLGDISRQSYPGHLIDVLLTDDHSDDLTAECATAAALQLGLRLKVTKLNMPASWQGSRKKSAIQKAAETSSADLLLFTDADCRVGEGWVASHVAHYRQNKGVKLVFGPFYFLGGGALAGMLSLEALNLTAIAAITNYLQRPTMCSGANMSCLRSHFLQIKPYDGNLGVASGDDEFLLHASQRACPGGAAYNKLAAAMVTTAAPESWAALYHQRRRWAGKWRHHQAPWPRLLAALVLAANAGALVCLVAFLYTANIYWLAPLLLKVAGEWVLGYAVANHFGCRKVLAWFLPLAVVYPFYAVFFGIVSNFGKFQWKGRRYG